MVIRRIIVGLLCGAVALLVAFAVVGGLALVLIQAGDTVVGRVVGWVAVDLGLLLAVDLGCLVVALATLVSGQPPDEPSPPSSLL